MYIENIKMDNSLKWVSFNVVSGQMTSNALRKLGEVLLIHLFFIPQSRRKYSYTNSYEDQQLMDTVAKWLHMLVSHAQKTMKSTNITTVKWRLFHNYKFLSDRDKIPVMFLNYISFWQEKKIMVTVNFEVKVKGCDIFASCCYCRTSYRWWL